MIGLVLVFAIDPITPSFQCLLSKIARVATDKKFRTGRRGSQEDDSISSME